MAGTNTVGTNGSHHGANGSTYQTHETRDLLPRLGLREYWYPALLDKEVSNQPVMVTMLGDDICFFRGKSGQVVAMENACPHRGAYLSKGSCEYKGTITCFYHGMVFDESGLCVAAFGEGPTSPMIGKLRAKVYPTASIKGVVWVWMGAGQPASLEQGIPEEMLDDSVQLFTWTSAWPCNWRPAVENYADSHVRYVHRNSALMLMRPILPSALPMAGKPYRVGEHRLAAPGRIGDARQVRVDRFKNRPYQDYYPLLGVKWPAHRWRFLWTWIFMTGDRVRAKFRKPFQVSEEWGTGQHLPSAVRLNYGTHMYTRWCIPVTENETRMFYFHAARRATWLGKVHEWAQWHLWHNWAMNKNFSEQDSPGGINLYYDRPERPSVSDQQTIEWRKLVLSAPELNLRKAPREKDEADRAFEVAKARSAASNSSNQNGANGHVPAGNGANAEAAEELPGEITALP